MSCFDKLFSALLTARLLGFTPLHNQQYGFRLDWGFLNALHNIVRVTQQRTARQQPTFVCFFDAWRKLMTASRTAIRCCTGCYRRACRGTRSGRSTHTGCQLQRVAGSGWTVRAPPRSRSAGCGTGLPAVPAPRRLLKLHWLGPERPVRRCPPWPIHVGNSEWWRPWRGQLHADDLSPTADTARGMQQAIDTEHAHSRDGGALSRSQKQWWWSLGARPHGPGLRRRRCTSGEAQLTRSVSDKYLRLQCMRGECGTSTSHMRRLRREVGCGRCPWMTTSAKGRPPHAHGAVHVVRYGSVAACRQGHPH